MSKSILGAFFVGRAMAGDAQTQSKVGKIEAEGRADIAQINAKSSQNTALALAVAIKQSREEVGDWRQYAARLRVNLDGRKLSEATLLAELKKANINHPLATEEGFAEIFKKNLADQYEIDDVKFSERLDEEQGRSVVEGRDAVS
jgi:hypothetical protein